MFISTSDHGVDTKNRVSVPASYRSVLRNDPHDAVYLFPHFSGAFLEGGGEVFIQQHRADIARLGRYDPMRQVMEVAVLGTAKRLDFDSTGRITLPKPFIEHAGLDKKATFVGCGSRFEIWNSDAHDLRAATMAKQAAKMMQDPELAAKLGGGQDLAELMKNSPTLADMLDRDKT
ncbi:division/cell wall cluster transcriptional repressor MraZ [Oceanicaulis sp. AH-315-P02]|nr:division/cell wall cluster transcriptional repressor MraZ [Robiginitomaculum sp.]MBN4047736.1 division/cell wall cluster transcriptional repressor MraZ [Oceanicaulis sp. AH-315-P02]